MKTRIIFAMTAMALAAVTVVTLFVQPAHAATESDSRPYFVTVRNECTARPPAQVRYCIFRAKDALHAGVLQSGHPVLRNFFGHELQHATFSPFLHRPSTFIQPKPRIKGTEVGFGPVLDWQETGPLGMRGCTESYNTRGHWLICKNGWWTGPHRLFR